MSAAETEISNIKTVYATNAKLDTDVNALTSSVNTLSTE